MDDFSGYLQGQCSANLTKTEQSFSGSKEAIFQKKMSKFRSTISSIIFISLITAHLSSFFIHWASWSLHRIGEISLCLVGFVILYWTQDFFQGLKAARSKSRPSSTRNQQSTFLDSMPPIQLWILIGLQEISTLASSSHYNETVLTWFYRLIISLLVHWSFSETYMKAKISAVVRLGLQAIVLLVNCRVVPWSTSAVGSLGVLITYVFLLNGLRQLNKIIRTEYLQRDIQNKFLNQFYTLLDSVPYPVFVFDPSKTDESQGMQLIFFNLSGNDIVKGMECFMENMGTEEDPKVNFLQLIDPQDEGTLLDKIEMLRQNKSYYETMTTELSKDVFQTNSKMRFDLTLWKIKWMERDVVVAMYNNDAYRPNKEETRFNSKFIEGLENTLRKNTEIIETAIANLRKFKQGESDSKALYESMGNGLADLMCDKLLTENLVLNEPWRKEDELKIFNIKPMITNLVDLMSKNIKAKGNVIRLEFNRSFPQHLIQAKLTLIRAFFFDLLHYIELRLSKGNIEMYCDCEDGDDSDRSQVILKFVIKIEAVRETDLPPLDFLTWTTGTTTYQATMKPSVNASYQPQGNLDNKLISWLLQLKEDLNLEIRTYSAAPVEQAEIGPVDTL